ncbi:MAG: 3-deoxy-7-phosphoheptulonate synthase [Gemmatimonadaceae bacterium]|nr:3-deoxy-7-phosphoheptulonate synthase [Gemmatimonadaceae bacterium]
MIIVTQAGITPDALDRIVEHVEAAGMRTHLIRGEQRTVIGCIGDDALLADQGLRSLPGVEDVLPVLKPYKLASREFSAGRTTIALGDPSGTVIGGKDVVVIAGPCSVEGAEMLRETARAVQESGARMLRGGAFKPRSSPYAFQGLGIPALSMLAEVRRESGMPIVTEVLDPRHVELVAAHADVLQIGARNMQNFPLLTEVGKVHRPVLLKRGLSATISELLMAAEYIMAQGNGSVILCERGIRTYETATRNTLDVAAVPVLKRETHLPVIVDPSHAGGRADLVTPLALAGIAAGADGLIVEVHPDPVHARSDAEQTISFSAFAALMAGVSAVAAAVGRSAPAGQPAGQRTAA